MNYFVIWPDGQRFGPVDVPTLQQWLAENRIDRNSVLEDARNGSRIRAELVLGPTSAPTMSATPFSPPTQNQNLYSGYPRNANFPAPVPAANGKSELVVSYIFGGIGIAFACCTPIIFPIIGLILAYVAKNKGQPNTTGAIILNILGIAISLGILVIGGISAIAG